MRVQTHRPRVRTGSLTRTPTGKNGRTVQRVAKRNTKHISSPKQKRRIAKRNDNQRKEQNRGSNILWMLMGAGALVAAGFVFALRSQATVFRVNEAETQLKAELEELANDQRHEILRQQRALSAQESDRAAKQAGLAQPRLSQSSLPVPSEKGAKTKKKIW